VVVVVETLVSGAMNSESEMVWGVTQSGLLDLSCQIDILIPCLGHSMAMLLCRLYDQPVWCRGVAPI
jgi:hypothetical protein